MMGSHVCYNLKRRVSILCVSKAMMREFAVPAALRAQMAHLIAYDGRFPAGEDIHGRPVPPFELDAP